VEALLVIVASGPGSSEPAYLYNIHAQMLDENITFLSRQTSFSNGFSLCDSAHATRISLKTNWRKRVRVERTDDIRDAVRRF
jgi:hypothetical protein